MAANHHSARVEGGRKVSLRLVKGVRDEGSHWSDHPPPLEEVMLRFPTPAAVARHLQGCRCYCCWVDHPLRQPLAAAGRRIRQGRQRFGLPSCWYADIHQNTNTKLQAPQVQAQVPQQATTTTVVVRQSRLLLYLVANKDRDIYPSVTPFSILNPIY